MPASANAAIYYLPDMADTSRPKLMGRHAAGEGFLAAFARHAEVERFYCCAAERAHAEDFARRMGEAGGKHETVWVRRTAQARIGKIGCLFVGEPRLSGYAFARRAAGNRSYSLCGLTHTLSGADIGRGIGDLLLGPVQPWDAVICTTEAARRVGLRLLDNWQDYLAERLGAASFTRPMLPVIPLGVDTQAYAAGPKADQARRNWRQKIGAGDEDIVILFFGRLSFHAKANPLPMYLAAERAAQTSGRRLHLVQAGWFANDFIENAFRDAARVLCPSVNAVFLDGRLPEVRYTIWHAADIFTSLSDNIQETFGLTPIEAMATGLPVVASDWDGYRDTLTDGRTALLVPTIMPPAGLGAVLAQELETGGLSYDRYIGAAAHAIAVDVPATAEAYGRLIADANLRRRLGAAGRKEARRRFDWRVIVRAYQELWGEMAALRAGAPESAPRRPDRPANPLNEDPFALFAHFATRALREDDLIAAAPGADAAALNRLGALALNKPPFETGVGPETVAAALARLAAGPMRVAELLDGFPAGDRQGLHLALLWLIKCDLVRTAGD